MSNSVERVHPSIPLVNFIQGMCPESLIQFARYTYIPRDPDSPRTIYTVPITELLAKYNEVKCELRPEEDIAIQSKVFTPTDYPYEFWYLPMFDFGSTNYRRVFGFSKGFFASTRMHTFFSEDKSDLNSSLVFSGGSYHLYIERLLTRADWLYLLESFQYFSFNLFPSHFSRFNTPFDTNWSKYQYMKGYASLRWTANAKPYGHEPYIVKRMRISYNRPAQPVGKNCVRFIEED